MNECYFKEMSLVLTRSGDGVFSVSYEPSLSEFLLHPMPILWRRSVQVFARTNQERTASIMGSNLVTIVRNFAISIETFAPGSHDVQDGCVTPGTHRVMRFDFLSHNAGDSDLVVGSPAARPDLFVWSSAHGHYHLKDFNEFRLFTASGQQVEIGHKQAFCLIDIERKHPHARADAQFTDCNTNQGISWGWADLYYAGLACQYIVIDGLPDGDYTLQSTTNSKHIVHEDCYGDNTMWTGLRIHGNTVTEINLPWIPEDRLSLNPSNVTAVQINSRWKVVDGSHWIMDFDQKRTAAERAVSVIKHYGLSHVCFVGRPACGDVKPMMYWLTSSNVAPSGAMAGEDAIPFDLHHVQVRKIGERGRSRMATTGCWTSDLAREMQRPHFM